jgi:Domain of unknown function (DUF6265)
MHLRTFVLIGVMSCSILILHSANAQDDQRLHTMKREPGAKQLAAKIADLAWIQGRWVGEGLGGTVEEIWSPPMGDSMLGMFRLVKNGKVVFSEHCVIVESEGSLVLRVKHFDANFKAWEEKDVSVNFPLVKLTANEAYFDGLTIRKKDADTVLMYVAIKNKKTGAVREEEFRYRRAKSE